jgi:hypothetical protein
MKTLLLLIAFATFTSNSIAQNSNTYIPFPDSIANWISSNGGLDFCNCSGCACLYNESEQYSMFGDTTFGQYGYKKLYRSFVRDGYTSGNCGSSCNGGTYTNEGAPQYFGAIRQDTTLRTVYITTVNTTQEELLYDFNLHLGDTLANSYITFSGDNYVCKIDSILLSGIYHKRFWLCPLGFVLNSPADSGYAALIEGVGSTLGFLSPLFTSFENYSTLDCFSRNNNSIYPNNVTCIPLTVGIKPQSIKTNSITLAPNPTNKEVTLTTAEELQNATVEVRNLYGNVVLYKTGLYGLSVLINVEKLVRGMYYINVIQPNNVFTTQKLVIE